MKQLSVPHTPQKNGVAKQINRTFLDRTRAMLRTTRVAKYFWAKAIKTAYYLINRSPSIVIGLKTLMEMWKGKPLFLLTCV